MLVGKGGWRIPFLERVDKLSLRQVSIDVKTDNPVSTNDFILCTCDGVCKVAVRNDLEGMRLAARHFLNMTSEGIASQVQDTLQSNLREILGTSTLKMLVTEREAFSSQVATSAGKDLSKLGLEILSFNLQNISDKQNLIEALGEENSSKIRQNAAVTRAAAEKEIAKAKAENEKLANDSKVEAELAIAEKNNDLAIKQAELKIISDKKKADADIAYKIQEQEQQKLLNTKTVEAQIELTKQEQVLSAEKVKIKQNELDASIKKTAEADKFKTETNAAADLEQRKRKAEAERYEKEQAAAAKNAEADAVMYAAEKEAEAIKIKAEAEAKATEAKGIAEAKAIGAKLDAEAEGMNKKAEAYKKYNNAALAQMFVEILPQIVENAAKPISAIKSINIYAGEGSNGVDAVTGITPTTIKQAFDVIESVTGVPMAGLIKAGSIEAKTDRNINLKSDVDDDVNSVAQELIEEAKKGEK